MSVRKTNCAGKKKNPVCIQARCLIKAVHDIISRFDTKKRKLVESIRFGGLLMEAVTAEKWIEDIQGDLSVEALLDFLELSNLISNVELHGGIHDKHIWKFSA